MICAFLASGIGYWKPGSSALLSHAMADGGSQQVLVGPSTSLPSPSSHSLIRIPSNSKKKQQPAEEAKQEIPLTQNPPPASAAQTQDKEDTSDGIMGEASTENEQKSSNNSLAMEEPEKDPATNTKASENPTSGENEKEESNGGILATIRSALSAIGFIGSSQTAQTSNVEPSASASPTQKANVSSSSSGQLVLPGTQEPVSTSGKSAKGNQSRKWTQTSTIKKLVSKEPTEVPTPPPPPAPPAPPIGSPSTGVPTPPENWIGYHVLHRATFGGTPDQLNTVAAMSREEARTWATSFLKTQLELDPNKPWPTNLHDTSPLPAPISINDSTVEQLLQQDRSDWEFEKGENHVWAPSLTQLQDQDLIRKFHSQRQLKEKMVYFWDNHFNTYFQAHNQGQYELAENTAYRTHGFGQFIDLLMANGKSPAMMLYLNTTGNRKENPNENYIREMLELHTLGVDRNGNPNGYSQNDIVEGAKTFTGWDKTPGNAGGFRFVSSRHSPGSKVVLGQTIPFDGSGPGEGERVLQLAARHPSTGQHLAQQLCEYFISDSPSAALVGQVASVFRASDGNIKKVLIAIFTSREFNDVSNYLAQVKTPLEFIVGIYRNVGVWSSRDPFRKRLAAVGQPLFDMPVPTGYKEQAKEWLNTNVLFHEVSFGYETAISGFGSTVRFGTDVNGGGLIRVWLHNLGLTTEDEVLGFLLNLTVDRQVTETEYQIYLNTMREGLGGQPFDLNNSARERALDRLLATILSNPRYKYQ